MKQKHTPHFWYEFSRLVMTGVLCMAMLIPIGPALMAQVPAPTPHVNPNVSPTAPPSKAADDDDDDADAPAKAGTPSASPTPAASVKIPDAQIDALVAPIALYPDPL